MMCYNWYSRGLPTLPAPGAAQRCKHRGFPVFPACIVSTDFVVRSAAFKAFLGCGLGYPRAHIMPISWGVCTFPRGPVVSCGAQGVDDYVDNPLWDFAFFCLGGQAAPSDAHDVYFWGALILKISGKVLGWRLALPQPLHQSAQRALSVSAALGAARA